MNETGECGNTMGEESGDRFELDRNGRNRKIMQANRSPGTVVLDGRWYIKEGFIVAESGQHVLRDNTYGPGEFKGSPARSL